MNDVLSNKFIELGPRVAKDLLKENSGTKHGRQYQIVMRWYVQFKK